MYIQPVPDQDSIPVSSETKSDVSVPLSPSKGTNVSAFCVIQ